MELSKPSVKGMTDFSSVLIVKCEQREADALNHLLSLSSSSCCSVHSFIAGQCLEH